MANTGGAQVQKCCELLRKAGLRPAQLWVPDTRRPNFVKECRRQSKLAAQADMADAALLDVMEDALADVNGWTA